MAQAVFGVSTSSHLRLKGTLSSLLGDFLLRLSGLGKDGTNANQARLKSLVSFASYALKLYFQIIVEHLCIAECGTTVSGANLDARGFPPSFLSVPYSSPSLFSMIVCTLGIIDHIVADDWGYRKGFVSLRLEYLFPLFLPHGCRWLLLLIPLTFSCTRLAITISVHNFHGYKHCHLLVSSFGLHPYQRITYFIPSGLLSLRTMRPTTYFPVWMYVLLSHFLSHRLRFNCNFIGHFPPAKR